MKRIQYFRKRGLWFRSERDYQYGFFTETVTACSESEFMQSVGRFRKTLRKLDRLRK